MLNAAEADGTLVADAIRIVRSVAAGEIAYVHTDHLGQPQKLTDATATLLWDRVALPFGATHSEAGLGETSLRFPGQWADAESGLHYNTFRDYDPSLGRYIQSDPIGLAGGLNTYGYVGADPISGIDPRGLTKIEVDIAAGIMMVDPERKGHPPYSMPITSGRGECTNKPACSNQPWNGPVPPGSYTAGISQLSDPGGAGDILRNAIGGDWGDWRIPISPNQGTNTHGRSGFFIHGGRSPGSAGCIDIGGGLFGSSLTDRVRDDLRADPDGRVPVNVK